MRFQPVLNKTFCPNPPHPTLSQLKHPLNKKNVLLHPHSHTHLSTPIVFNTKFTISELKSKCSYNSLFTNYIPVECLYDNKLLHLLTYDRVLESAAAYCTVRSHVRYYNMRSHLTTCGGTL